MFCAQVGAHPPTHPAEGPWCSSGTICKVESTEQNMLGASFSPSFAKGLMDEKMSGVVEI